MIRRYLSDLREFGGARLAGISLLTVAGGVTDGIGLLMLVPLLDLMGSAGGGSSISNAARDALDWVGIPFTIGWVLVVYVVLIAVRTIITRVRLLAQIRFRLEFIDWQRLRLFDAVARADWMFHVQRRSSDLMHTITSDVGRIGQGTNLVMQASSRILISLTYLLVAFRLSVPMTAIALAMSLVVSAALWPLVRRSRQLGELQTSQGKRSFGSISQFLSGMKLAKAHGTESLHVDEYATTITELRGAQFDFQRVQATATVAYQIATAAAIAVLVWIGVEVVEVATTQLIALVVVFARVLPMAGSISGDIQGASNMLPAYENSSAVLDEALAAAEPAPGGSARPIEINQAVGLVDVRFTYPEAALPSIDGVTCKLPARTTTAFVGASGAGKTTLADLTLGLMTPDSGEITVDGQPLYQIDLASWRSSIAYVPQEPFLFHDTLRANVSWAAGEISDQEILDLLDTAALSSLVADLPNGLDTIVGDRGHRLSGGERQRVVLARALARQPALLVLDEATSSLDGGHEQQVQQAIDALHGAMTVVVIAHRLDTIRHADQIVVLDKGRILETGVWDQLIESGSLKSLTVSPTEA